MDIAAVARAKERFGKRYAMFEAIRGSATRVVAEGRARYADPSSTIRAAALEMAIDVAGQYEREFVVTGRANGATGEAFADYIMDWVKNPGLKETWVKYIRG